MELKDIKDVLSFAAFRPEPDNSGAPWEKRFQGSRVLLLNIGRDEVSWRSVGKKGDFEISGSDEGEFGEVISRQAEEWRTMTDNGWVAVSINHRFIMSLERNLPRKPGYRQMLKTNPKQILGAKYDRGKAYGIHHSATTNASLVLACDESLVKSIEEVLKSNGFRAARISVGIFAMINRMVTMVGEKKELSEMKDLLLLASCKGSIAALRQKGGQWSELRCRAGLDAEDPSQALQMIAPFLNTSTPDTRVLFMNNETESRFAETLKPQLQNLMVVDITEKDQLWSTLIDR
jgi:hypothetical protein